MTKFLIQNKPAFDIGIGINDNFKVYTVSLIFVDILLNFNDRDFLIGVGVPFLKSVCFYFKW